MSTRHDRLIRATAGLVRILRFLNGVIVAFAIIALAATFVAEPRLASLLSAKYGPAADVPAMLLLLRCLIASVIPSAYIVERLFRALGAIVAAVRDGLPFAPSNADHLRTIGWMLLALQLLDLGFGIVTWWATRIGVEVATWQPSVTGWVAVLIAFILVRVFAAGTAMRDDLAGTV